MWFLYNASSDYILSIGGERMRKPILTSDQLVQHMADNGIKFTIIDQESAKRHLSEHNNYFKLSSYRKNYGKITSGPNKGQYEDLEFAYLRELARLDTLIRHLLLEMTLDIEHFLKVLLLKKVEENIANGEDGYKIIEGYLFDIDNHNTKERSENTYKRSGIFNKAIKQNLKNPYCSGLANKYADDMPVWACVELMSFGELKDFIEYYSKKIDWELPVEISCIDRVRQLRNACAHGNAIINDLKPGNGTRDVSSAPVFITNYVKAAGISKTTREKKLSNPRVNQIVHLLYVYDKLVTSKNTRYIRLSALDTLINERMPKNKDYFQTNPLLTSTYHFFRQIVANINY